MLEVFEGVGAVRAPCGPDHHQRRLGRRLWRLRKQLLPPQRRRDAGPARRQRLFGQGQDVRRHHEPAVVVAVVAEAQPAILGPAREEARARQIRQRSHRPLLQVDDHDVVDFGAAPSHVERDVAAVEREIGLGALQAGVDDVVAIGQAADDDGAADEGADPAAVLRDERAIADADVRARRHACGRQHGLVAVEIVVVAGDGQDEIAAVTDRPTEVVAKTGGRDVADELARRVMPNRHPAAGARLRQVDHAAAIERPVGVDAPLGEEHLRCRQVHDRLDRLIAHHRRVGQRAPVRRDARVREHAFTGLKRVDLVVTHGRRLRQGRTGPGREQSGDRDERRVSHTRPAGGNPATIAHRSGAGLSTPCSDAAQIL